MNIGHYKYLHVEWRRIIDDLGLWLAALLLSPLSSPLPFATPSSLLLLVPRGEVVHGNGQEDVEQDKVAGHKQDDKVDARYRAQALDTWTAKPVVNTW